jgi:hypothetical protein
MDEQDIDREMVFKQMKKIKELEQQLQESKQREAKLRECVEFYANFHHIRKNFGDQNPILESDEYGAEDTLSKAEQCLVEIDKDE